jgi:hypothetical protein
LLIQAARNAGITPVQLVKEPEAAALYTLRHMGNKGLQVGDAFVLCDAGGGTVDLISYEIMQLNPLQVKELVSPSGKLQRQDMTRWQALTHDNRAGGIAGSLMLNKRFEEWIKDVVGERPYLDLRDTDAFRRGMKQFDESIKPSFRSIDDEEQYVTFQKANLESSEARGLVNDTITITG